MPSRAGQDASRAPPAACIQTPDCGGGKVRFDDELFRKNGQFVPEDLKLVNPDRLKQGGLWPLADGGGRPGPASRTTNFYRFFRNR